VLRRDVAVSRVVGESTAALVASEKALLCGVAVSRVVEGNEIGFLKDGEE